MRVAIINILFAMTLTGCAIGDFPQFPAEVVDHYAIDIKGVPINPVLKTMIINPDEILEQPGDVSCLHFTIVSKNPYKLKYNSAVPLASCNGVGGYRPGDSVKVYNWMQDAYKWAEGRTRCMYE